VDGGGSGGGIEDRTIELGILAEHDGHGDIDDAVAKNGFGGVEIHINCRQDVARYMESIL
jgi:hypothetical protein